jgi:hypothetical protein
VLYEVGLTFCVSQGLTEFEVVQSADQIFAVFGWLDSAAIVTKQCHFLSF